MKTPQVIPFPDPFPAHGHKQVQAALFRFGLPATEAAVDYAIDKARGAYESAEGSNLASARLRTERGWIRFTTNAVANGWAIDEGFEKEQAVIRERQLDEQQAALEAEQNAHRATKVFSAASPEADSVWSKLMGDKEH